MRPSSAALLAPGASAQAVYAPGAPSPQRLPAVDDTILREDERSEILNGQVYRTMGAEAPHAMAHFDIPKVLGSCLAEGYEGAVDMLSRVDQKSEFAPDVSIFPRERDAEGHRKVDEVALEIIDTTRLGEITRKAGKLAARGVRRIFVLDVTDRSVREWDHGSSTWTALPETFVLADRSLVQPVPLAAFLDDLLADDTVARALLARNNSVLQRALGEAETRGEARGEARGHVVELARLFSRRLRRELTASEHGTFAARLEELGAERMGDVVLDLDGAALAGWLADPKAR